LRAGGAIVAAVDGVALALCAAADEAGAPAPTAARL
jgi:hypothetical protein